MFSHVPRIGTNRNTPYWGRPTSVEDVDTSVDPADGNTNSRRSLQIINRQQTIDGSTAWTKRGYGPCSQSCAQGVKIQRFVCLVQSTRQVLDDSQCVGPKPKPKIKQCNSQPCPPFYDVGSWSECSRSCGMGRKTRRVICRQRFAGNFTSAVMYQKCGRLSKPNSHEHCQIQECARWEVTGEWSKCNVKCATGSQTRRTECKDGEGRTVPEAACSNARRPAHVRQCDAGPCVTKWFVTKWRECSSDCDRGVQRRNVHCLNTAQSSTGCPARTQPHETRTCARTSCGIKYEWFAGKWGSCSSNCGAGVQERPVVCLRVNPDGSTGSTEETDGQLPCNESEKPDVEQPCNTQSCGSRWYHTQWTECTASCNGGTRSRDVQCLDEHGDYSDLCAANERPRDSERCNTANCVSVHDPNCTDRLRNCQLVLRARFCSYTYYRTMCCLTCFQHNSSPDSTITFRK
uniref:Thrombospondin type-1 domain-containing protein 4-like n=1 Tax=Phallusia mammillata TaxID=59560 RepID=A0A6F9DU47_9ASCI|nr:thrombospondin type-1 domain-containing protein 4-like [Phallusia mammillata]